MQNTGGKKRAEIYYQVHTSLAPRPEGVSGSMAPLITTSLIMQLRILSKKSTLKEWSCKKFSSLFLLLVKRPFNPRLRKKQMTFVGNDTQSY